MIIAIDGPSAAGKGTLSRALAAYYNLAFLDTGLLYRQIALTAMERGIGVAQISDLLSIASEIQKPVEESPIYRTLEVAEMTSQIATIADLRELVIDRQRFFAHNPPYGKDGTVLDGRDIGTVVCPDADRKIYITADLDARVRRRQAEFLVQGIASEWDDVYTQMKVRDERDQKRSVAPMKPADDAYIIDTTTLTEQVVFQIALEFIDMPRQV